MAGNVAVEHDMPAPIGTDHGLLGVVRQISHRQTSRTKCNTRQRINPNPFVVRTTRGKSTKWTMHRGRQVRALFGTGDEANDAAHGGRVYGRLGSSRIQEFA